MTDDQLEDRITSLAITAAETLYPPDDWHYRAWTAAIHMRSQVMHDVQQHNVDVFARYRSREGISRYISIVVTEEGIRRVRANLLPSLIERWVRDVRVVRDECIGEPDPIDYWYDRHSVLAWRHVAFFGIGGIVVWPA